MAWGGVRGTLDRPWVNNLRESLCQDRLAAELDRDDVRLRAGQHASLLADLTSRVTSYPLDERLAGQLMLALYRAGRPADALGHYKKVRHRLAEELGSDPSPPLRDLHQRILTADPALAIPVTATAVGTLPRQLPADLPSFVNRQNEIDQLHGIQGGLVVISGTAGVGKTALAVHWAHRIQDRFPDGQLYVNLRGFGPTGHPTTPTEAVRVFLDALRVPASEVPLSAPAQTGLFRSLLAGRRMLLLLDNASDADQVRPLLPGSADCLVLVTSRHQLPGLVATEGARPLTLDVLRHGEAVRLLGARLGADRLQAEPAAVDEIVKRCAGLPLALAIVAARAATVPAFPLAATAADLRSDAGGGLDAFAGADPATDVRAVFSWSYQALSTAAGRLFRLVGSCPGPDLGMAAAGCLAGLPAAVVRPLLAELTTAHLLAEPAPGRYAMHDLLRGYATDRPRRPA